MQGDYPFHDCKIDLGIRLIKTWFYGKYRVDARVLDPRNRCLACLRGYVAVVPRLKRGSQIGTGLDFVTPSAG